jgi:phosphoribosylanthranilate isomerase
MGIRIKICGVTTREAVAAAVTAGADAVGFVFAESPRRIDPARAALLAWGLPPHVAAVAVFRHPSQVWVREVVRRFLPAWLQIDAEDLPALDLPPALRVLPVFRDVSGAESRLEDFRSRYRRRRPRLLFESRRSGNGETPDWNRAAGLGRACRLVLAGGLRPENVIEAIARVRPYAVDVSSGVESSPGVKEPERMAEFVRAVREGERRIRRFPTGGRS